MHFQPSLPRFPIPKLEDSCRHYLAALRPILSVEEYGATENIVNEFSKKALMAGVSKQYHMIMFAYVVMVVL